jgi:hypothetical protein
MDTLGDKEALVYVSKCKIIIKFSNQNFFNVFFLSIERNFILRPPILHENSDLNSIS